MSFIDKFIEYIRQLMLGWVGNSMEELFTTINRETAAAQSSVAMTPDVWNPGLWSMATGVSEIIKPVAGAILACVLCLELITVVQDRNSMHDVTEMQLSIMRLVGKLVVSIVLITKTPEIIKAFFSISSWIVNRAAEFIASDTAMNPTLDAANIVDSLQDADLFFILKMLALIFFLRFALFLISILIQVVILGRMIEIYILSSLAPLPMTTFLGAETKSIGINYLKSMFALALQSFFIMMCFGIYAVFIREMQDITDVDAVFLQLLVCAGVLALSLFKTSQMAKSLLTAH